MPAVDCVLFADPKQSVVDIVQAAGRAMRPFPGKTFGFIVVPIVVPEGLGFEEFAETTDFRQVARVIAALSTQDDRIAEEFRAISSGRVPRDSIVEIVGNVPLPFNFEIEEFRRAIALKLWERVGRANWRSFEDAREFARSLNLKSKLKWEKVVDRKRRHSSGFPSDVPRAPHNVYKDKGWIDYGDWLGTHSIAKNQRVYRSFEDARAFARSLKLTRVADWPLFCKGKLPEKGSLPDDIPVGPNLVYKDEGWISHSDWIGTSRISTAQREFRSFEEARTFARSLGLTSIAEWQAYCADAFPDKPRLPADMPKSPWKTYASKGYVDLPDWLNIASDKRYSSREFLPFVEARNFVRRLGLKTTGEWYAYSKGELSDKPSRLRNIPSNPNIVYKGAGWLGMSDWLGNERGR